MSERFITSRRRSVCRSAAAVCAFCGLNGRPVCGFDSSVSGRHVDGAWCDATERITIRASEFSPIVWLSGAVCASDMLYYYDTHTHTRVHVQLNACAICVQVNRARIMCTRTGRTHRTCYGNCGRVARMPRKTRITSSRVCDTETNAHTNSNTIQVDDSSSPAWPPKTDGNSAAVQPNSQQSYVCSFRRHLSIAMRARPPRPR